MPKVRDLNKTCAFKIKIVLGSSCGSPTQTFFFFFFSLPLSL